jgi:hypothetical protein
MPSNPHEPLSNEQALEDIHPHQGLAAVGTLNQSQQEPSLPKVQLAIQNHQLWKRKDG